MQVDPTRLRSFKNSYDALLYALELLGVTSLDQAYQAMPDVLPRTLRRAWARSVLMGMCSGDEQTTPNPDPKKHTHTDTTADELQIAQKANDAGVSAKVALMAVMRFHNPAERVGQILDDIRALISHGCRIFNPTGLFVRTVRSGGSIRLPVVVEAARELQAEVAAPEREVIEPGSWAHLDGDWLQVVRIVGTNVELTAPEGFAYRYTVAGADTTAPLERVRKARRSPDRPEV